MPSLLPGWRHRRSLEPERTGPREDTAGFVGNGPREDKAEFARRAPSMPRERIGGHART